MAWLRLDDGFAEHPKLLALETDAKRWTWLRVLSYAARRRTPEVPVGIRGVIGEATPAFLTRCVQIGLLDKAQDGSLTIHDWAMFNPEKTSPKDIDQRVMEAYELHPYGTANEIASIIGGNRKTALQAIRRHNTSSTPPVLGGSGTGSGTGSRTAATHGPVPQPLKVKDLPTTVLDIPAPELVAATPILEHPDDHGQFAVLLDVIGVHDGLRLAAMQDIPRATAWALKARDTATSSPAGFFRSTFETGRWPAPPEPLKPVPDPPCLECGLRRGVHDAECSLGSVPPDNESEAA